MDLEKSVTKAINRCLLEMGDCRGCPYRGDKCSERLYRDMLALIEEKNKVIAERDRTIREKEAELIEWRATFGPEAALVAMEVSDE